MFIWHTLLIQKEIQAQISTGRKSGQCFSGAVTSISCLDVFNVGRKIKKYPEHHLCSRPLLVLLIIQFISSRIKSSDGSGDAGRQWQPAVRAGEGVRLCKNMLCFQHSRHLGLTHYWAWFHPSTSKQPESQLHLTYVRGDHIDEWVLGRVQSPACRGRLTCKHTTCLLLCGHFPDTLDTMTHLNALMGWVMIQ